MLLFLLLLSVLFLFLDSAGRAPVQDACKHKNQHHLYCHVLGIMENKVETTIVSWVYIKIMENKMDTTIVYWGYIGIMENKMGTTIVLWGIYRGNIGVMNEREAAHNNNNGIGFSHISLWSSLHCTGKSAARSISV